MMRRVGICVAFAVGLASSAAAQQTIGCEGRQAQAVIDAVAGAKRMAVAAASGVGDNNAFATWFGPFRPARGEAVRRNLKSIASALRSGSVVVNCAPETVDGCNQGEFAWVYPGQAFLVNVCPPFFDLPALPAFQPGTAASANGTRDGTIIHEVSHFVRVARTKDHCYERENCSALARNDPHLALENADTYQYFAEDVLFYDQQPASAKPRR